MSRADGPELGATSKLGPPARPRTPGSGRMRVRRRVHWTRLLALALIVFAAVTALVAARMAGGMGALVTDVGGTLIQATVPQPVPPSVAPRRPADPITVLVMGTETAPSYAAPQLTDSMMILSLDPTTKQAALMSVPRDLWVDIPGFGMSRINAAFENGGPALAELTVEKYVGVPIDYYAIVNYASFVKLVNTVGGINVKVPYTINDTCYPNSQENKCTVFRLSAGPHHLDGTTALKFIRERHTLPEGDLTREADQQLALFALKTALLQPGNILHIGAIVNELTHMVTTNLPYADLPKLAEKALQIPKGSIQHGVLGYSTGAVTAFTTKAGAEVLLPDTTVIHREAAKLFAPVLRHMGEATIQVENGSPTKQPLATFFSGVLDDMGATTLTPRQAPTTDHATNAVYWNTAVTKGAQPPTLAYMLSQMLDARLQRRSVPDSAAQIVVILGRTFPQKVQP